MRAFIGNVPPVRTFAYNVPMEGGGGGELSVQLWISDAIRITLADRTNVCRGEKNEMQLTPTESDLLGRIKVYRCE